MFVVKSIIIQINGQGYGSINVVKVMLNVHNAAVGVGCEYANVDTQYRDDNTCQGQRSKLADEGHSDEHHNAK